MSEPNVLYSAAGCIQIHFDTLEHLEEAVRFLAADPVGHVILIPNAHLLFLSNNRYALRMPSRANGRVLKLLKESEVPFAIGISCLTTPVRH